MIIQCFAKQSYLFSSLFSLIFSLETTILEKREERKEKSEKNKKKRQSSDENCRFFLAEKERFELSNGVNRYTISNRARSTSYATSPHLYGCTLNALGYYITAKRACQQ